MGDCSGWCYNITDGVGNCRLAQPCSVCSHHSVSCCWKAWVEQLLVLKAKGVTAVSVLSVLLGFDMLGLGQVGQELVLAPKIHTVHTDI